MASPGFFVAASAGKVRGADHDALTFHISDRERKKPRHVCFASEADVGRVISARPHFLPRADLKDAVFTD